MAPHRDQGAQFPPRLIIHGGAGNISRATMTPERYRAYRSALLEIITRASAFMTTPTDVKSRQGQSQHRLPSALETATFAVSLFEDNPLFNSGHGAVFTRDGINELEAAVMVTKGRAKRGVGVMGLRRVKNPILLARHMLEHGDADLAPSFSSSSSSAGLDVPSAQGHTQLHGATAEALAARYGLPLVEPSYFFTQLRWDEHVRALERERSGASATATWSADEFLPQGTCGAVALDPDGVVCCATSTGGLTNKLTGRIGDTPVIGAGSWAESWDEAGDPTGEPASLMSALSQFSLASARPLVGLSSALLGLLGDCLPIPASLSFAYSSLASASASTTTRSMAVSGTGNGDSFLRVAAAHTAVAMAQYRPISGAAALSAVSGPGGVLQQSAADRWGHTGEGQGGLIGIEAALVRSSHGGGLQQVRTAIIQDYNCGGMFRAWIDEDGETQVRIFREDNFE